MQNKTSIPRLRRVRFKDGRVLEVFTPKQNRTDADDILIRKNLSQSAGWAANISGKAAGYAIMAWDTEGASVCYVNTNGTIPAVMVTDFVRNKLLADRIESWIIDSLNGN